MNEENSLTPEQRATKEVEGVENSFLERGLPNLPHDLKAELLARKTEQYRDEGFVPEQIDSPQDTEPQPEIGAVQPEIGVIRNEAQGPGVLPKEESAGSEGEGFVWTNEEEDWDRLSSLRKLSVNVDLKLKNGEEVTEEEKRQVEEYKGFKQYLAGQIRKSKEATLSPDTSPLRRSYLEEEINDSIFRNLVSSENDIYVNELKRLNNKNEILDKGIEAAKSLLGTKAVKWYLGLSKNQRRAFSFGVGGMAGLTFGASVAPGMVGAATYLAWRAARFGVSGLLSSKASEWANKKWSLDQLEEEKNKSIEELKNSGLSIEEQSKGLKDIEANFKKAKIIISAKKIGTTIAAGAGAGMLTGLAEGLTTTVSASANVTGVAPGIRGTVTESVPRPTVVEPAIEGGKNLNIQELFSDESVLKQEVAPGDSMWKLLGNTVEKSKLFEKLTGPEIVVEAKKDFILSNLINENNLASGGPLKVGDKVDFTKVFEDNGKIEKLFEKAEGISDENVINIRINNEKIEAWLTDPVNKGKALTPDVVKEILQKKVELRDVSYFDSQSIQKPIQIETKSLDESISQAKLEEPNLNSLQQNVANTLDKSEKLVTGLNDGNLKVASESKIIDNISFQENEVSDEMEVASQAGIASVGAKVANIDDYRNGGIRSMQSDSKKLVAGIVSNEKIEEHLKIDVNNIYGKKGILGIGKVDGVNTPEWKEISEQNAAKVIGFYAKPENSDLPKKIIEKLSVSQQHRNLVEYVDLLRGEARSAAAGFVGMVGSDVAPYNNESVVEYLRRLGKFIMEHPKVEIPNGTSGMSRAA